MMLHLFNNEVILKLKENQIIYVFLKVKMMPEDNDKPIYRSVTKMQRVNKETIFTLLKIFYNS